MFERLEEYPPEQLGLDADAVDGPFLLKSKELGLLVSLRGEGGGSLSSPAELRWPREVPAPICSDGALLFLRRGATAVFLGLARVVRRGSPARDGFKTLFALTPPLTDAEWRSLVEVVSAPAPPPPEEALAALTPASSLEQRLGALRDFAERWFGVKPGASTVQGPPPLRVVHELVAGSTVFSQNRLVDLSEPHDRDEPGKRVFYVENQGVYVWAFDPEGGEDPAVFRRLNDHSGTWAQETTSLSVFLIQALLFEAVLSSPFGASAAALPKRKLTALLREAPVLPLGSWAASETRFLGGRGVIGVVMANGDDLSIWLAAKERERLEPLERRVRAWDAVRF